MMGGKNTYQGIALVLHSHTVDGGLLDDVALLRERRGSGHDHVGEALQDLGDYHVVSL